MGYSSLPSVLASPSLHSKWIGGYSCTVNASLINPERQAHNGIGYLVRLQVIARLLLDLDKVLCDLYYYTADTLHWIHLSIPILPRFTSKTAGKPKACFALELL